MSELLSKDDVRAWVRSKHRHSSFAEGSGGTITIDFAVLRELLSERRPTPAPSTAPVGMTEEQREAARIYVTWQSPDMPGEIQTTLLRALANGGK